MVRLDFCTVVMPDEYDFVSQFEQAMKDANKFHKRHHEECPSPYFAFDAGKVYGLVLELQRMKAAQQSVQPTVLTHSQNCASHGKCGFFCDCGALNTHSG